MEQKTERWLGYNVIFDLRELTNWLVRMLINLAHQQGTSELKIGGPTFEKGDRTGGSTFLKICRAQVYSSWPMTSRRNASGFVFIQF